jgi:hypothetical protein
MEPLPHPRRTRRFGSPIDWSELREGECGTLEIADVEQSGRPFMESLWRPGPAELELLASGGALVLAISGRTHPVVSLGVTGPAQLVKPEAGPEAGPEPQAPVSEAGARISPALNQETEHE